MAHLAAGKLRGCVSCVARRFSAMPRPKAVMSMHEPDESRIGDIFFIVLLFYYVYFESKLYEGIF